MKLENYTEQLKRLPLTGKQIIGRCDQDTIIVYQAFNHHIAEYATQHQKFGGPHYSFSRMSWIKPGFLWMMYRSGWANKKEQERILAITLPLEKFRIILLEATISSYSEELYATHQDWKQELERTEVRLQWDPDHDPEGNKQERKAIQLGMKGHILKQFCTEWISGIADITEFVLQEYAKVKDGKINELQVPYEDIINISEPGIKQRLGIN
jgi:hypothetical protein